MFPAGMLALVLLTSASLVTAEGEATWHTMDKWGQLCGAELLTSAARTAPSRPAPGLPLCVMVYLHR